MRLLICCDGSYIFFARHLVERIHIVPEEMKICISGVFYPSKKTAKLHVRSILRPLVGHVIRPESEHYSLISGVFERSPRYEPGARYFVVVEKLGGVGVRAVFEAHFVDISVSESISGNSVSQRTQLTGAMRNSIRQQVRDFKKNGADKRCALCDCSGFLECDHETRFRDLMRAFLQDREAPSTFAYDMSGWKFIQRDSVFEAEWLEFHLENARLRLLCPGCHLKVTREQRDSDSEASSDI